MSVIVYTTQTCGYCHQLKAYLRQKRVPFSEHDVSGDQQAAAEMVRLSGQQGVPVTLIDGQVVVGFNRPVIEQLLANQFDQRPRLGVSIATASRIAAQKGMSLPTGAYVGRVQAGSPSEAAGMQPGDVILELSGQVIQSDRDVHRVMATVHPTSSVDVLLWRDGQTLKTRIRF